MKCIEGVKCVHVLDHPNKGFVYLSNYVFINYFLREILVVFLVKNVVKAESMLPTQSMMTVELKLYTKSVQKYVYIPS